MRVIVTFKARPKRYRVEDDLHKNGTWMGTVAVTRTLVGALWNALASRQWTGLPTRIVKEARND